MRFREQQERARATTRWLVLLFAATVLLTVLAVNAALALAWRLQFGGIFHYPRWFFETNTAVTLGFVLGGAWLEWLQLRGGGAHVAEMVGGREVTQPQTLPERRLRNIVDEMAIASGLPPPRIFVLDREDAINAFAAGWEPADSVVTVTQGALERLTRDELEGVVAHEFAHLLNGDTLLNMRLIGMVYGLQMVFTFGRSLMTPLDDRGRRGPTWLAGLALAAAGSIGWFGGRVLKAGVSREREYLADASAVQFTRLPQGLGNALRKVQAQAARGERIEHANADMLSHLFLSSDGAGAGRWLATHPPLAERVRRLLGHDMPPLPDDPLPQEQDQAAELPPLAFTTSAPDAPASVEPAKAAAATSTADLAALSADIEPQLLESAVLACLLAPDADAQRWQALGDSASSARRTVSAVRSLPAEARLPWLEHLGRRAAALDAQRRAALLRQAGELVQADGRVSLIDALRLRVLHRQLLLAAASGPEPANVTIAEAGEAVGAITLDLATLLPRSQRETWTNAVLQGLGLPPLAPGAAPGPHVGASLERLALLARLQRPALVKQWLAAAPPAVPLPRPFADALRCVCVLIDTPLPPQLAGAFQPVPLAQELAPG